MKGQWFTFASPALRHPLTVVWVPDEKLQFQWAQPNGAVQILVTPDLQPPDPYGELVPDGERYLPYPLVKAARRYLDQQKHVSAQTAVLKFATDRNTSVATSSEFHLQAAASEFLRDRPAVGKWRMRR